MKDELANKETDSVQLTAGQILRERLKKNKTSKLSGNITSRHSKSTQHNRSASNTPTNSNRKSRKGMRPG